MLPSNLFFYTLVSSRALCKGTVPIPGVLNLRQAEENLAATQFRLSTSDTVEELDRAALNVNTSMIQNRFQTN